jgi:glutathione peroxidase
MKNLFVLLMGLLSLRPGSSVALDEQNQPDTPRLLDVNVRTLDDSKQINLSKEYDGKVILIVNTASKCAFTSQYEGLEELYAKYKDKGLVVLGFPSNDFANQEPGTEEQIKTFCRLTYGVKFPMFGKTRVREKYADELYKRLGETAGEYPAWNFHKYLINRDGKLVASFSSFTSPQSSRLVNKIESLL